MILRCLWMMPRLVPLVVVGLLTLRVNPQVLLYVLLDGDPAVVDVHAGTEDVRYCSRIMLISATVLPDLLGPSKMPVHGTWGTTGSEGCLLVYSVVGNSLIFPISFVYLPNSKPSAVRSSCWPPVVSAAAGGLAPVGFKQLTATQLPLF